MGVVAVVQLCAWLLVHWYVVASWHAGRLGRRADCRVAEIGAKLGAHPEERQVARLVGILPFEGQPVSPGI